VSISLWTTNALTVINGVVMIEAINRIRNFFVKNGAENQLNTWYLSMTKYAFYIYIASQMWLLTFETIYYLNPTEKTGNMYIGSLFYYYPAEFASQVMLCAVFFEYCQRYENNATEVDKDALLKAHLWNSYVNTDVSERFIIAGKSVQQGFRTAVRQTTKRSSRSDGRLNSSEVI
jgi:hypothetical protein